MELIKNNTVAIIRKGTTIEQIKNAIAIKYSDVKTIPIVSDHMCIVYKDGDNERTIVITFTNSCEHEVGIPGVSLVLGMCENSIKIARYLCETFGGYLDEDTCDDEGFYPINFNLYQQ